MYLFIVVLSCEVRYKWLAGWLSVRNQWDFEVWDICHYAYNLGGEWVKRSGVQSGIISIILSVTWRIDCLSILRI